MEEFESIEIQENEYRQCDIFLCENDKYLHHSIISKKHYADKKYMYLSIFPLHSRMTFPF